MRRNRPSPKEFRFTIKGIYCVYCGDPASCLDHFPPYSACLSGFLLPACRECNGLAGTDYPYDLKSRAKLVRERLETRYRRLLDTPEWSSQEMRQLGYNLKTMVKSWGEQRKIVIRRTNWDAMSYLAMLPSARDFVALAIEVAGSPEKEREAFQKQFSAFAEMAG